MARIKIRSNPYQRTTEFQSWDEKSQNWKNIDRYTSPNSPLIADVFVMGFFPFQAKKIVDEMLRAYQAGSEKIALVFEGTDDEYRELESICGEEEYISKVALSKSSCYLENARDILPKITAIFKEVEPFVSEGVRDEAIRKNLEKFSDASSDVIPICVMGNYSSGKSTFLNALVGYELLPSSDAPTTAKVYKISPSKDPGRAVISFAYQEKRVEIRFTREDSRFITEFYDPPLAEQLKSTLEGLSGKSIPVRLNRVLESLNTYVNKTKDASVSDLIEIEAPFDEDGIWSQTWNNFVFFDTPGSNSVSHIDHSQVLKNAMENLSNGLPIFVLEHDSLDSADNLKLYQEINDMAEMDKRFTMIVVNKADAASLKKNGLTEADRTRILDYAIPRKIYAGGLYFVSSIIGLGAKNDQVFLEDHNAEVFADQYRKYEDPASRSYKQLYRYNILPEQIKRRHDELCARHKNPLYANSGLYSVELAIETFARGYSHYNKCRQSQLFLSEVIRRTADRIAAETQAREAHLEENSQKFEKGRQMLIEALKQQGETLEAQFLQDYDAYMAKTAEGSAQVLKAATLKSLEEESLRQNKEARGVEERKSEIRDAGKSLGEHVVENFANAVKERNFPALKKIGTDLSGDWKEFWDNTAEFSETRRDAARASSEELICTVKDLFTESAARVQARIEEQSKAYWEERACLFKEELSKIITNSPVLTEQERRELSGIIIQYQTLAFENRAETIFSREAFVRRRFGDVNRLNTGKLAKRFNREMQETVREIYDAFQRSHKGSFHAWKASLLNTVMENIVELSPELHALDETIKKETAQIEDLEFQKGKLSECIAQIREWMAWKEA